MRCDLDRELHLGRLARHLGPVVKLDDPYARRLAYRRAGLASVGTDDDRDAARIAQARRRALSPTAAPSIAPPRRPEPSSDDLVERMAECLARAVARDHVDLGDERAVHDLLIASGFRDVHVGRYDIIGPALERARAKVQRRSAIRGCLDRATDVACLGTLILGWAAAYCLLCPPARAAARDALLTDEGLAGFAIWAPVAIAALLVLALRWRDRGVPVAADEPDEPPPLWAEPARGPDQQSWSGWQAEGPPPPPPSSTALSDREAIELLRRDADGS